MVCIADGEFRSKEKSNKDFGELKIRRIRNFGQSKVLAKNHLKYKLEILENSLRSPKFYKNGREIIARNNLAFGL